MRSWLDLAPLFFLIRRVRRPARRLPPTVYTLEGRLVLSPGSAFAPQYYVAAHAAPPTLPPLPNLPPDAQGFTPLFDGVNLAGWVNPFSSGRAWAQDGEIRITSPKNIFLMTQRSYRNFILELDALIPPQGNSGIQFRSFSGPNLVFGYQADIDTLPRNWAGGLYYQGKGWLVRAHPPAPVRAGQWNHYRVEAVGDHIRIFVNGTLTVDTHDSTDPSGHIGLQDHGGAGVYRFKNIRIKDLGG
jgi:hypothetical protein